MSVPKTCKTKASLARALGVSEQTVYRMIKRTEFPFLRRGPWSPTDVAAWREQNIRADPGLLHHDERRAEQDGARITKLVALLCELHDADPRFWLRAVTGVVAELQATFANAPDADTCSNEHREAFYASVQAAADARAKLKTLALPSHTDAAAFLKLL